MGSAVFKHIDSHDINITPFKVYKSWKFDSLSELTDLNIDRYQATKPDKSKFSGGIVTLDSNETLFESSSLYFNSSDDRSAASHWYVLNNLYYKRDSIPYYMYGIADAKNDRILYDTAAVLSLPQKRIGERIHPKSVKINYSFVYSRDTELIDDGKGNLIDTALSASISDQLMYLNFNAMSYEDNYLKEYSVPELNSRNGIEDTVYFQSIMPDIRVTSNNVWITPNTGFAATDSWGNSALFHRDGYIRIENAEMLNFRSNQNYAISFWYEPKNSAEDFTYILTKKSTRKAPNISNKVIQVSNINRYESQYPYDIIYDSNSNELKCTYATSKTNKTVITASLAVGIKYHIVLQKSGSNFELYVNGNLSDSGTVPDGNIHTDADIFIGSAGTEVDLNGIYSGAQGLLSEFFMFGKALSNSEIQQLYFKNEVDKISVTNTNIVGHVIYDHGLIIITDPRPKYGIKSNQLFKDVLYNSVTGNTLPVTLTTFSFEYKSTVNIFEHEYFIKVSSSDFNFTSNPTIRINNDLKSDIPKPMVANKEFGPYITTVGLYNDVGQLLAVGKLGTPIKKRSDVDLTIVMRFDT